MASMLLLLVIVVLSIIYDCNGFAPSSLRIIKSKSKLNLVPEVNHVFDALQQHGSSLWLADEEIAKAVDAASSEVSRFSQVDKTGVIGFFADGIEKAIDLVHTLLQGAGLQYTYGIAIIILTCLSKSYYNI
jgi:hypothetical protein